MSGLFERKLAEHIQAYLRTNQPRGGQILLAEFHSGELADRFADGLVDLLSTGYHRQSESSNTGLPKYDTDGGVPVSIVRVVPDIQDETEAEQYEITQGYATKMRNEIAASVETDRAEAMIMILETDASLDTLEASEELFGSEAPINLQSFRDDVLNPSTCDTKQGQAFLRGLLNSLDDDSTHAEDVQVLQTLCEIRAAVDEKNALEIQRLIGNLPQYVREDQLGDDWFSRELDTDTLENNIKELLDDNRKHADQLKRSHRAGVDTESKLQSMYEQSFVDKVLDSPDWSELNHSEARKGRDTGGVIRFTELSIQSEDHRIYEPLDSDRIERSIIARPKNGEISLRVEFTNDIEDTPRVFHDHDGNDVGTLTKRNDTVTATIESLPSDKPWFGQVLFWVGKKTTRGKPTHVFNVAAVPDWFFTATEDATLDVDVESSSFISNGDKEITLRPYQHLQFKSQLKSVELKEDQIVEFDCPLTIDPNPPDVVERVSCEIAPLDGIPIRIDFLTEVSTAESEETIFPLMLAAIVEPERWASKNLTLPDTMDIDADRGEIYTASDNGIRLEETALEIIQIEEQIVADKKIHQRLIEGDDLDFGEATDDEENLPEELRTAYLELFDHFEERGRTPSTDSWDEPTKQRVEAVIEAYVQSIDGIDSQKVFEPYEPLREICTIQSTTTKKVWLTPFHPLLLAYGLRIANWRDEELLPGGTNAGFRRDQFVSKFNANGLHPYRTTDRLNGSLLRGMPYAENPLWTVYSPIESPGSITPRYMERVVRDKLYTFVKAFPTLFQLHPGRQLELNLINMGDLRPVVKGLYEFYKKIEKTDIDPPLILLRIYGGDAEGEALERFFTQSADSRLRDSLEKKNDELVDRLRSHVTYVRAGEYGNDNQHEAHLTFFRGLLEETPGVIEIGELTSGMLNDALFPRESIDIESSGAETIYTVGFSCDDSEQGLIYDVARRTNALEAGHWNNSYQGHQTIKKNIESTRGTDLTGLWDDSLWVVHVQPNVGIDFYVQSDTELKDANDRVMIHYSDQYDSSSPDYDVITSTNKRSPYLTALNRALTDANLGNLLDPETVLSVLVAIDGELALDLQQAEETEVVETIGFVGGLALSQRLLNRSVPDHLWIPLSLNELSRHDSSYKGNSEGLLQYDSGGKASDDICFVGIPTDEQDRELKLWVVETKGGSSHISTGREQIHGAVENLSEIFDPAATYADENILLGEFGKVVIDAARRMQSYDVIGSDDLAVIDKQRRSLLEGKFSVSFIKDVNGSIGEVIRVREDTPHSKINFKDGVRSIETPIQALQLVGSDDIETILPDLNLEKLAFNITRKTESDPEPITESSNEQIMGEPTTTTGQPPENPVTSGEAQSKNAPSSATDTKEEISPKHLSDTQHSTDSTGDDPSDLPDSTEPEQGPDEPDVNSEDTDPDTGSLTQSSDHTDEGDEPVAKAVERSNGCTDAEQSVPEPPAVEAPIADEESPAPADPNLGSTAARIDSLITRLSNSPEPDTDINKGQLASNIRDGFKSLGVEIHPPNPSNISVGPRKIGVDVLPKEGQKIEGILNNLNSLSVHIKAHGNIVGTLNPSKGAVRLEIPHDNPQDIYLREGFEAVYDELQEPLTIPLGVDTERTHHSLSLPDERHALIAGATGSGKSNFLSTVISSLVVTHDPSEVRMSLLDPKGVDFGRFQALPHVETYEDTPTDCTDRLLNIVEQELPRRKEILRDAGVPSVAELNENAEELNLDPIPYHVVVVDEYADLKMSVDDDDEFEKAVTRLAQVGRALGIIILLATQRPSADIVSGKIKANFPCRISFRLPSNTDSRVILDKPGAEDLEGAGDMITKTQAGEEYHLQGYRLTLSDANTIRDWASEQ